MFTSAIGTDGKKAYGPNTLALSRDQERTKGKSGKFGLGRN